MISVDSTRMIEQILPYERDAFLWLNESHNVFFDSFMWIYSGKLIWIPLAIVALGVFFYKVPWKLSLLLIVCFVLLATFSDQLSASVIKPLFERLRPTHHPDFKDYVTIVNGYRGGKYGFVSAHSANSFGIATFLSFVFKYRRFTVVIFICAILNAYSRIYLGVHFITDIIGGMMLGVMLGFGIYKLFQYLRSKILKDKYKDVCLPAYEHLHANIICATILVLILTNICISFMNFRYGHLWLY